MMAVPFKPTEDYTFEGVSIFGPGYPPAVMGFDLITKDGEPALGLVLERPVQIPGFPAWASKETVEGLLMEAFLKAHLSAFRKTFCTSFKRGPVRSDFIFRRNGSSGLGADLTRFTCQGRRMAHAEFGKARTALLNEGPSRFQRLRGHLVYFWVIGKGDDFGFPPRFDDFRELLAALQDYEPSRTRDRSDESWPETMPRFKVGEGGDHWRFHTEALIGPPTDGEFRQQMGFEVGFCFQTEHRLSDVRCEFDRIVRDHDRDGVDACIVQIGAPDHRPYFFPADERLMDLLVRPGPLQVETVHVSEVYLHRVRTGEIIRADVTRSE